MCVLLWWALPSLNLATCLMPIDLKFRPFYWYLVPVIWFSVFALHWHARLVLPRGAVCRGALDQ